MYRFTAFLVVSFGLAPVLLGAELDLDGDTDRTGEIDGTPAEEALEDTQSVIVLNNCDRESAANSFNPDNFDRHINGASDLEDVEPIRLRELNTEGAPVVLEIRQLSPDTLEAKQCVRVFGTDGNAIIGPQSGTRYSLTASDLALLATQDLTFYVEGLQLATRVTLEAYHDGTLADSVILEVAPFIFTPHTLPVVENYVVRTPSTLSQQYVNAFTQACQQAGVTRKLIRTLGDVWVEDELTWGYTESPRKRIPVAFHMLRQRELEIRVKALLGPDQGWFQAFDYDSAELSPTSLTYGGNVEISPPTENHPFGRVYYGNKVVADDLENTYIRRKFHKEFREFFERHELQPPIELHTNWLAVGHIDEIVTFVPKTSGDGYFMVLSSPKLAFDILRTLPAEMPLHENYDLPFNLRTVGDFFNSATLQRTLEEYNNECDRFIFGPDHGVPSAGSIKGILMEELGLEEADVVEVPTVFFNDHPSIWAGLALTPGVVNISSMGDHSLVPEPFFAPFKTKTAAALEAHGGTALWIDNWDIYHVNAGEVHCGSQERRQPFEQKWWK